MGAFRSVKSSRPAYVVRWPIRASGRDDFAESPEFGLLEHAEEYLAGLPSHVRPTATILVATDLE